VAGWWFDGGYRHIQFNDAIAAIVPPKTPRKSKLLSVAPEKGGDLFVEACARLRGMGRDVSGVLIGEGPALATWKELARRRGVDGRIVFPGWRPDVADWLAVLDIYMAPSLEESFGLAILEAQAAGLPVVAARVGGIPEVVTDRENALLVPRGDVDALASAVTELLDNPALARRLGDNGRRNVEERFSIENTAARYADVYTAAFARCNDRASGGSMARR
jgi:glycosyltransferase involved in cell wall biosynthesis